MAISSRQTIKDAYATFKEFPRTKQLILYSFLPMLLFIAAGVSFVTVKETPILIAIPILLGVIGAVLMCIVYVKTLMAIVNYKKDGYIFNSLSDFYESTNGALRVWWRGAMLPILVFFLLITAVIALASISTILSIVIGVISVLTLLWIFPKFVIVMPYLTVNKQDGFMDALKVSKGYIWYLSKVILLLMLCYIALDITVNIIDTILGAAPDGPGGIAAIFVTIVYVVVYYALSIFSMFIYNEAYFKILADQKNK